MNRLDVSHPAGQPKRFPFFDENGLPWSSRLRWGMLLVWVAIFFFGLAPFVGIYIGVWLRTKRQPALVLVLYLVLTGLLLAGLLLPSAPLDVAFTMAACVLWFAGALVLRREVMRYYKTREGIPFRLNPVLAVVFGPWYIGGHLRADFPLDVTGKAGPGVLKLVN